MSKIKILDSGLNLLATVNGVFSAARVEKINADNTMSFSTTLRDDVTDLINGDTVFELDGDYFDVAYFKREQQDGGALEIDVEAEHVSYRLNNADYDVDYFTLTGTPADILAAILGGTGFSVGTVEFTDQVTFSLQESASRRALLMQFIAYLGGEALFNQFTVSVVAHRGSTEPIDLVAGKSISVLSKALDKRTLDDNGNPTVSYTCGLIKPVSLALGDEVYLKNVSLDIDVTLRIVSITTNPYRSWEVTVEIGNYVNSLEDDLYRIETQSVKKDALMNGCRIGPEYGFEAVRNDQKARAYFRSDGMAMQSGDGAGSWTDRLKYEYDSDTGETTLVFNGKLSADMVEALSAVITPNLYADKATISELTVDQLDTSDKARRFLNADTSDANYIRTLGQIIQFITASVASVYGASRSDSGTWDMSSDDQIDTYYSGVSVNDATGEITYSGGASVSAWTAYNSGRIYRAINSTSYYKLTGANNLAYVTYDIYAVAAIGATNYEQAKDRNGGLLYWTDDTQAVSTTTETDYPVYVYVYNELVKMELSFDSDGENYVPRITFGAGNGTGDNDKLVIYKENNKAVLKYTTDDGTEVPIELSDFVDAKMRRLKGCIIDKTAGTIWVRAEGQLVDEAETLTFTETDTGMEIMWPDGYTATLSIS